MLQPGTLLFTYGSLMERTCLRAVTGLDPAPGHAARVDGWRLAFGVREPDGAWVAGLFPERGCRAYGVVYRVPRPALEALDAFEGVPERYRRRTLWVEPLKRRARQAAIAYIAAPDIGAAGIAATGRPDPTYLETILSGARAHDLPDAYIDWVRAHARGEPVGCYAEGATS